MTGSPTPEPNSFLQFWIIVGFIAMVLGQIVTIVVMLTNRKQKREVNFAFAPASKAEHDQHVVETATHFTAVRSEMVAVRSEMAADRKANEVHASERSKTIFRELKDNRERLEDQISSLDKKVAGLETASELQTQQLARLDTKLDRIIENKLT